MKLNRTSLRRLILEGMDTFLKEQMARGVEYSQGTEAIDDWKDINLVGLTLGGRPHLEGTYQVTSDGTYNELGDQVEMEVVRYGSRGASHPAVGRKITLAHVSEYNDMNYQNHPIFNGEMGLQRMAIAAMDLHNEDIAMMDSADDQFEEWWEENRSDYEDIEWAEDDNAVATARNKLEDITDEIEGSQQEKEDELLRIADEVLQDEEDRRKADQAIRAIMGDDASVTGDESTWDRELIERDFGGGDFIVLVDGENNRATQRFRSRLQQMLSDISLNMPEGTRVVAEISSDDEGRIRIRIRKNELDSAIIPDHYLTPGDTYYIEPTSDEPDVRVEDLEGQELVGYLNYRLKNPRVSDEQIQVLMGELSDLVGGLRADSRNRRAMRDIDTIRIGLYATDDDTGRLASLAVEDLDQDTSGESSGYATQRSELEASWESEGEEDVESEGPIGEPDPDWTEEEYAEWAAGREEEEEEVYTGTGVVGSSYEGE